MSTQIQHPRGNTVREKLNSYALVRTSLSSERSLLSWMRTSASLYAFGFSIIKFFQFLEGREEDIQFSEGPTYLGVLLIATGATTLALGVMGHHGRLKIMRKLGLLSYTHFSISVAAALGLLTVGIVTAITGII